MVQWRCCAFRVPISFAKRFLSSGQRIRKKDLPLFKIASDKMRPANYFREESLVPDPVELKVEKRAGAVSVRALSGHYLEFPWRMQVELAIRVLRSFWDKVLTRKCDSIPDIIVLRQRWYHTMCTCDLVGKVQNNLWVRDVARRTNKLQDFITLCCSFFIILEKTGKRYILHRRWSYTFSSQYK